MKEYILSWGNLVTVLVCALVFAAIFPHTLPYCYNVIGIFGTSVLLQMLAYALCYQWKKNIEAWGRLWVTLKKLVAAFKD